MKTKFCRILFCKNRNSAAKLAYFLNYKEYLSDKILLLIFALANPDAASPWFLMTRLAMLNIITFLKEEDYE